MQTTNYYVTSSIFLYHLFFKMALFYSQAVCHLSSPSLLILGINE